MENKIIHSIEEWILYVLIKKEKATKRELNALPEIINAYTNYVLSSHTYRSS